MKKMVKGEITVFLSLVFLLLLTLVGALLESASIQLAKNERRADAGRAVESAFAEYQKDLLERYGIFAIEGSYESGTMSEENILNRLSFYGAENIETEIAAIRYLTDQNGKEFLRQAVEYEKMKTGAAAIENLTGKVSEWKEQELKANEYGKENIETSKELDQMLESEKEELPAENNHWRILWIYRRKHCKSGQPGRIYAVIESCKVRRDCIEPKAQAGIWNHEGKR